MANFTQRYKEAKKKRPQLTIAGFRTEEKQSAVRKRREERVLTPEEREKKRIAAGVLSARAAREQTGTGQTPEDIAKAKRTGQFGQEFARQAESGIGRRTGVVRGEFVPQTGIDLAKKRAQPARGGALTGEGLPEEEAMREPVMPEQKDFADLTKAITDFREQQEKQKTEQMKARESAVKEAGKAAREQFKGTPFESQIGLEEDIFETNLENAFRTQEARSELRENRLRQQLSSLSLGDEGDNVLASLEGRMGRLSLPQLEKLATAEGMELTDDLRNKLTREGKSAIEREKIERRDRLAETEYTKNQLERSFDRAITERERFNTQQDAKTKRLLAAFAGGRAETLAGNAAVLQAQEEGRRALEDLRGNFADKTMLVGRQADSIIETYNNNVGIIENQMSEALENKYAEITNRIDELLEAGITDETELANSVAKAKRDYAKTYRDVTDKAFNFMQAENQRVFENTLDLKRLRLQEEKLRQTDTFTDVFGMPSSSPTTNTSEMVDIGKQPNSDNCVKWLRQKIPNLPFGLFTTADKLRAVQEEGFTDRNEVRTGDAVLTAESAPGEDSGHVARIMGIDGDDLILEEANYRTGRVTRGRRINMNDAKVLGFIHPSSAPAMSVGGNIEQEGMNKGVEAEGVAEDVRMKAQALAFDLGGTETERNRLAKRIIQQVESGKARNFAEAKQQFGLITKSDRELQDTAKEEIKPLRSNFNEIESKVASIPELLSKGAGIADVAVVVNFLKVVDPRSVARETEVASVENAVNLIGRLEQSFNKLNTGQKLTKSQRDEMNDTVSILSNAAAETFYKELLARQKEFEEAGIPVTFATKSEVSRLERQLGVDRIAEIQAELEGRSTPEPIRQPVEFTGKTRQDAIKFLEDRRKPVTENNINFILKQY